MPLVFFGMLMKDDLIPGDIKSQLKSMFPQLAKETEPEQPRQAQPQLEETPRKEEREAPKTSHTAAQINEILDGLDMRLAKGEISEETYNRLRKKWESKLGE